MVAEEEALPPEGQAGGEVLEDGGAQVHRYTCERRQRYTGAHLYMYTNTGASSSTCIAGGRGSP